MYVLTSGGYIMAYIKVTCPYCQGTHVVFNGKTSAGAQKCICRDCNRTFQTNYTYNGSKPGMKEKIVDMVMNGSGTRDTARVLKISKGTVTKTLRNQKKRILRKQRFFE